MSDLAERGGGAAALAVRRGAAAVVGGGRRPRRAAASTRRSISTARPVARPHRARSIARQAFCLLRGRPARLERPLARGGTARARLSCASISCPRMRPWCRSSISTARSATRPSISTIRPLRCSPMRTATAAFGEAAGWRRQAIALRTRSHDPTRIPAAVSARIATARLPQRSNPHMHLFEAALAWIALDGDPAWRPMADGARASFASSASSIRRRGALARVLRRRLVAGAGRRRPHRRARPSLRMGVPARPLGPARRGRADGPTRRHG